MSLDLLDVLDACASEGTFPMLDNGYIYLAATRLSLYRTNTDWALVIETFGSNHRAGGPILAVDTFGPALSNRKIQADYITAEAHARYLQNNPFNETRFFGPIDDGPWMHEDAELVADNKEPAVIRGIERRVPNRPDVKAYEDQSAGIQVTVHEACRFWAAEYREDVLALEEERRGNVPPNMGLAVQLDEWHHPDLVTGQQPSDTECFRQLAAIARGANPDHYAPTQQPNTHWSHWPEGGTL